MEKYNNTYNTFDLNLHDWLFKKYNKIKLNKEAEEGCQNNDELMKEEDLLQMP